MSAAASDERTLLAGTVSNAAGLVAGVGSAFGVQVLLGRALPGGGLGLVTVAVQAAFVAAAGSRVGMDMAAIRLAAIGVGAGSVARLRSLVDACSELAGAAGALIAFLLVLAAPLSGSHRTSIAIAAASLPLAGVANVYLGATRGLKQMRPTLLVYWIGQPVAWIVLAGAAIAFGGGVDAAVWAYDASWLLAAAAARTLWRHASDGFGDEPAQPGELREAVRYGLPRAPSALLAQALFWADLFVLAHWAAPRQLDIYSAVSRIAQVLLLFLTSSSLVFSPFAADLHARGRRDQLDRLFKTATRWALAATLPAVIVLLVAAADVLRLFGSGYGNGASALRILLAGQLVNVATGSVGFVLIMVGRTRLDLIDNAIATVVMVALAAPLSASHGIEGAALAAAVTLAGVNVLRLAQVARLLGIQPYDAAYLPLLLPAGACAAAALGAHVALSGPWWAQAAATAAAGAAAYAALLPAALPAAERGALYRGARRMTKRPSTAGTSTGSR